MLISIAIFCYLSFSFVLGEINFLLWKQNVRFIFVIIYWYFAAMYFIIRLFKSL